MNRPYGIILPVAILLLLDVAVAYAVKAPRDDYWIERSLILKTEQNIMIGGDVKLNYKEQLVNQTIMNMKMKEVDDGFANPRNFLPAQNFLTAARQIEKSEVFKILKKLPKGAVLHSHDTAIVSWKYVYWNITFRPNLYVCDVSGVLHLRFFDKPDMSECEWMLLQNTRQGNRSGMFEERIIRQLTMATADPVKSYPDVDTAWAKPVYEDHFYQGLLELYRDNVQYLELRSTLPTLYDLDGKKYGPVEVAKIYKNVTDRFVRDHPDFIGMKLIYAPLRKCSDMEMEAYLATARQLKDELPEFIAGFDLVGQEDKGYPLEKFANRLRELGDDVQLFFHAGETNWYGTSTDQNLVDAVLLNSKRIGHGYALLKHPKVMELVRKKNIAIEVAPISNQVLNLVKDLRNHPASMLFSENYPVVISNDDPGLWGARGLSYDFYEAFVGIMSRDADLRALKKLASNSIAYSSLNTEETKRATKLWNRRWEVFIERFSNAR
ncbi:adenosine deaminase 2-like isoform X2 [Phymastichus coffea]|uniref:adenosine deaminase 2-like isoform X2 n=1 Tax=Phymastichus coffea TaxID=108790 RepID=UPI00273CCD9F|nr:adenosine deaminase 2-like isoform X2 [Phymastichus coffea]